VKARLVPLLSAERASKETVDRQARLFTESPAADILERLPMGVAVFNGFRQIVLANDKFRELAPGARSDKDVVGLRLGEAFACLGSELDAGGCGASELCRSCEATRSLVSAIRCHDASAGDCSIRRRDGDLLENLDFRVWVWPLAHGGEQFQVAILSDIRAEKRLALMERIFYHDILNIVSGMQGVCELMREEDEGTWNAELDLLLFAAERVTDLIISQRDFSQAERGEYELASNKMGTLSLLSDITALMRREPSCRGKTLSVDPDSADAFFASDRKLVTRILVNMQKNALEATPPGGTVTTGCVLEDGHVRFWVHNAGSMPEEVRTQLFRRTFSTKGRGRGLGTYGMKLFAETYLGGEVGFTTSEAAGTTFFVRLPCGV
jgi:signal transduction histidine kinase